MGMAALAKTRQNWVRVGGSTAALGVEEEAVVVVNEQWRGRRSIIDKTTRDDERYEEKSPMMLRLYVQYIGGTIPFKWDAVEE
mgnify:CR=1 FL=1